MFLKTDWIKHIHWIRRKEIEKIFDFEKAKANNATHVTGTTNSAQHQPIQIPNYIYIDK